MVEKKAPFNRTVSRSPTALLQTQSAVNDIGFSKASASFRSRNLLAYMRKVPSAATAW
jgi:hypothetical protein